MTRIRFIAILLAATQLATGCGDEPARSPDAPTVVSPADTTAGQVNTGGGKEWIVKRYDRVAEMESNGQLRCDSIEYECPADAINGLFTYCYAGGELVRATHARSIASHAYLSESYYYDGDELYFAFLQEGSWGFASPPGGQYDETVSATIDHVNEERRYFENGNMIDHLYKSYEIKSWEEGMPAADEAPNTAEGTPVADALGPETTSTIKDVGTFSCPD